MKSKLKIHLQYGQAGLSVHLPAAQTTVLEPQFVPGLEDEQAAFTAAVRQPIQAPPLISMVKAGDRLAIVIADITRALPSDRLLPWLLAELSHVPPANFTIIIGTGSHRTCTPAEIERLVGQEIAQRYKVINHNAYEDETMALVGKLADSDMPLQFNKAYVEADKRIIIGFIEPHLMAGFSGGYKAVFPGITGIKAIMHYHRAEVIGHPLSTWGVLENNPTQAQIRQHGAALPVDFCINVTLNKRQEISRFFCGAVLAAHEAGCAFARETAMAPCERPFPLVITTNSGYPLDLNLYQSVKGMCAAAEIVTEGGEIITAARCDDGFPDHGNFTKLLLEHDSPQALLETIYTPGFHMLDQWQAQKLAQVQLKAKVALFSELPDKAVQKVRIEPIREMKAYLEQKLSELGPDCPLAVLPEGPMTIPYFGNLMGKYFSLTYSLDRSRPSQGNWSQL